MQIFATIYIKLASKLHRRFLAHFAAIKRVDGRPIRQLSHTKTDWNVLWWATLRSDLVNLALNCSALQRDVWHKKHLETDWYNDVATTTASIDSSFVLERLHQGTIERNQWQPCFGQNTDTLAQRRQTVYLWQIGYLMRSDFLSQTWLLSHAERDRRSRQPAKGTAHENCCFAHQDFCQRPICKLRHLICFSAQTEARLSASWFIVTRVHFRPLTREIQFECDWKMPRSNFWRHQVQNGCRNTVCWEFRAFFVRPIR